MNGRLLKRKESSRKKVKSPENSSSFESQTYSDNKDIGAKIIINESFITGILKTVDFFREDKQIKSTMN